ncbi:MAG: hypothetical protein COV34_01535 [Candidatus Zambryskibacteria bacterium CG10_big_fil_rev_8_21_14_0_10_42_12]|uniref:Methyltransferase domain-containing protein n=1 Tax=Candidatus Zambryskibacteria bacterium CG10_big_fil_rev_8_21_14_0_10_42_12 TaxID=1975115 RepID=A0A2H0QVG4_9BACT|nr:MAG: hypothetical protein COV34_01535 [Candidatus Zambryskibacteria bacterium CG10_big_fil_rev_8_21_14_0_10_42_12]
MNKKQITIDTYNRSARALAQKFNHIGPRVEDVKRAFSFFTKKNPKVVELGCGNGRDAKEIIAYTNDYIGIDASEGMISLAKEYVPETNFQVSTIESFVFPENTDIIFAFASLLHLSKEEIMHVLKNTYQKLSLGGIFYISVKMDTYHERIKTDDFGERVFYFYDKEDWRSLAGETGYKIMYEDTQNLLGVEWLTVVLQK